MQPETLFSLLSDSTRLRCLALLQTEKELCVCELVYALQIIQPKISRHLSLMRDENLVVYRRDNTWNYYQINLKLPTWIKNIIINTTENIRITEPYKTDKKRLVSMENRPKNCVR